MQYDDLVALRNTSMEDDIPSLPTKTSYDAFPLEEEPAVSVKYPNKRKTRRFNDHKAREDRATVTNNVYHRIVRLLPRLDANGKKLLKKKVRALRPSLASLRKYYQSKGESEEIIKHLVTPENYPHLRNVWISKKQEQVLFDIIDGRAEAHAIYIQNGFY